MSLKTRVRALERAAARPPGGCALCGGLGGGGVAIYQRADPGEAVDPEPPRGCPACGRAARARLEIFLPSTSEQRRNSGRVWPAPGCAG